MIRTVGLQNSNSRFSLGPRVWHKNGVKALSKPRRARPPLNADRLREMALRYVGKYSTTRAKLRQYLARKLRERGWEGSGEPEIDRLAERFSELGYIDDAAFAMSRSRALSARGYGTRRVADQLRAAGVEETDGNAAISAADEAAVDAALRLAKRRRLGPFAPHAADPHLRQKWISTMIRAGHGFVLARAIIALPPTPDIDLDQLRERLRLTDA